MGAALGRGNQVDVAFLDQLASLGLPEQGPVHCFLARRHGAGKGLLRQRGPLLTGIGQVVAQTVLVVPAGLLSGLAVVELHLQTRAQHRLGLEQMQQPVEDRKSTRLNSSHVRSSYAVFCLKKKTPDCFTPRAAVGSSRTRTFAPKCTARAMATHWRSPPERVPMGWSTSRRSMPMRRSSERVVRSSRSTSMRLKGPAPLRGSEPRKKFRHTGISATTARSWWTVAMPRSRASRGFFFNDTATTEIYTLSLHDALPISARRRRRCSPPCRRAPGSPSCPSLRWTSQSLARPLWIP